MLIKGFCARGPSVTIARATSSLPVPLSPRISTVLVLSATRVMASYTRRIGSLPPISSQKILLGLLVLLLPALDLERPLLQRPLQYASYFLEVDGRHKIFIDRGGIACRRRLWLFERVNPTSTKSGPRARSSPSAVMPSLLRSPTVSRSSSMASGGCLWINAVSSSQVST